MEINKLIRHLENMRDIYDVKEVHIPRLGYNRCSAIDDEEFDPKWIQNGILKIEGKYEDEE